MLNIDRNAKTVKGRKYGYVTGVLYLSPADLSGREVCPARSAGCSRACLNTAGRGGMNVTQRARLAKTERFFNDRAQFMLDLENSIRRLVGYASKRGFTPFVRLNGTSDLAWERIAFNGADGQRYRSLMHRFPTVTFYDYTKRPERMRKYADGRMPHNYILTFSADEQNHATVREAISKRVNVAVVLDRIPGVYMGAPVIDGDVSDLRPLDPPGVVVALKAKGKARRDETGFVHRLPVLQRRPMVAA